jgi:hypothetical protein
VSKVEPRVYEYVASDGTVFWSFTKYNASISPPLRLVRQSQLGTLLSQFITYLRQQGKALSSEEDAG